MVRPNTWSPDAVGCEAESDSSRRTQCNVAQPILHSCPGCGHREAQSIFEMPKVPVSCCTLWLNRMAAQHCGTGRINLAACPACGLVFNSAFDPRLVEYGTNYENALDFSPAFQAYVKSLVDRLVTRYSLSHKKIIEIGCGNGVFLTKLCAQGGISGIGYDPSFAGDPAPADNLRFVKGYFGKAEADKDIDFICCRHVLEHLEHPLDFLTNLRSMLRQSRDIKLYFEVPNGVNVLAGDARWDVIYEHVSYFTEASLRNLLKRAGFEVLASGTAFNEQFLFVEASITSLVGADDHAAHLKGAEAPVNKKILSFSEHFNAAIHAWSECLKRFASSHKTVAFWGAGSKGVTFLNLVPGARSIRPVVDLNPRKQGMFVAGTGQLIVSPESLADYSPEIVIVLNPAYRSEITARLMAIGLPAAKIVTSPL
jgi:SAM-dependent methyltransferase